MDLWQWFAENITIPVAAGLVAWLAFLQRRMSGMERDISTFVLKAAETYATKQDLQRFDREVMHRFDQLEAKLDRLIERRGEGR